MATTVRLAAAQAAVRCLAAQRAAQVLTDPVDCGPVTLALCQDVQAEAYGYLIRGCDHRAEENAWIGFAAHARSMGPLAEKVDGPGDLDAALQRAKAAARTYVIVIDTAIPCPPPRKGAFWWDVAVPAVSERQEVEAARQGHQRARAGQAMG